MRVRVKFTKNGCMKFIGHLDVMRYFQKALRRAGFDVALSGGYSPHMLMSFAAPLGVGVTSDAEYFDLDLRSAGSSEEMEKKLNSTMAEGIEVLSVRQISEDKSVKCMTQVAAADYEVRFRPGKIELPPDHKEKLDSFLKQDSVMMMKKTKKGQKEIDILPLIYSMKEEDGVFSLFLSQGSVNNLKPEMAMSAYLSYMGIEAPPFSMMVHRKEIYAATGDPECPYVSLESFGREVL
ncbi:MAG TPA: Fe-S oxidoreductase [Lachnospiraceae bacterium]|nr:Fe-S oxidoreductase [Lachnospiraceae bacterium]